MLYLFRILYAMLWSIICGVIDIFVFLFSFKTYFGLKVNTTHVSLIKPIDTLGEHGIWSSRFHWALKIENAQSSRK